MITDRRLLLCSPDEQRLVIALTKQEVVTARPTTGLFGKNPGLEIDYLDLGRTKQLKLAEIESVDSVLGTPATAEDARAAFLAKLEAWLEPRPKTTLSA